MSSPVTRRSPFRQSAALLGLVAFIGAAAPANAWAGAGTTYYVSTCGDDSWTGTSSVCAAPDGPKATIKAAIDETKNDGDVVIVGDGTYTGVGNTNIVFVGFQNPQITIRSENGAGATTIDGQEAARFIDFVSNVGGGTVLEGFTVVNGRADEGAAVLCRSNADPTIRDCVFEDGLAAGPLTSDGGGAIKCETNSDAAIEGCVFTNNRSLLGNGGAVYFDGNSHGTVTGCLFQGNQAGSGDVGGGAMIIANGSNVVVTDCDFVGNSVPILGGAVAALDAGPGTSLTDCLFEANTSDNIGAGIATDSNISVVGCTFLNNTCPPGFTAGAGMFIVDGASPDVTSCVFEGNSSSFGAGITVSDFGSDPRITNCLFIDNSAVSGEGPGGIGGGLVSAFEALPKISNCTFVGNSADVSGGAVSSIVSSNPTFSSCIMFLNTAPLGSQISLERIEDSDPDTELTIRYSNVLGGERGVYIDTGPTLGGEVLHWGPGNISADPRFTAPYDGDYSLRTGSACIDAGDNTGVPSGVVTDLAGNPRFLDDVGTPDTGESGSALGDPIVDIGAYEFQGTTLVCPDVDGDGMIGFGDLTAILSAWGPCTGCPEDVNGDGLVGMQDLCAVLAAWGECPE